MMIAACVPDDDFVRPMTADAALALGEQRLAQAGPGGRPLARAARRGVPRRPPAGAEVSLALASVPASVKISTSAPSSTGTGWMAYHDGRLAEARDAVEWMRAALEGIGEPVMDAIADCGTAYADVQGEPERALERLQGRLEHTLKLGAGVAVPWLLFGMSLADIAAGRAEQAAGGLEVLVPLIEGRENHFTSMALGWLAEARRLLADGAAEATALRAQATAEQLGNRLVATFGRLTLGRLAAARGDWPAAQQHVLAHLDACAEGGHATYVPSCLDALAEVAAGLKAHQDAVRLFGAAERARAEIGAVRIPPEQRHWAAIDSRLREALGADAYESARKQGGELSVEDAVGWARRARGPPCVRPPAGTRSPPPSTRPPSSDPKASPIPRSVSGCSSRRRPSRPTSPTSSRSSTSTAAPS
jgi:hypothetical protein